MNGSARVLVRLPNWLGDVVMALPALAAIRAGWPHARLGVAVPRGLADLASLVPGVDEVVPLKGGSGWLAAWGRHPDPGTIAARSFDTAILMTNSFGSALVMRQADVPERWGYAAAGRRGLLTRAVARASRGEISPHHSAYYAYLARSLGFACEDPPVGDTWGLVRADTRAAAAAERVFDRLSVPRDDRPLVAVAPGAAYGHAKQWPLDRVARLLPHLCDRGGFRVLLIGAAEDRRSGVAVEDHLRALGRANLLDARDVVNLIGHTTLLALVGVLTQCRGAVSNDSGAMHLAAAVGVHVAAVFGPTRDHVTRPLGPHRVIKADVFCRPCMLRECPLDHRCMTRVSPEAVAEVAFDLWAGAATPASSDRNADTDSAKVATASVKVTTGDRA